MNRKICILVISIFLSLLSYAQDFIPDFKALKRQHYFIDNFTDNTMNWDTSTLWIQGAIKNNSYNLICKNNEKKIGLSYLPVHINEFRNFEIEAQLQLVEGNGGIVWGLDANLKHFRAEIQDNRWLAIVNYNAKNQQYKKLLRVDISEHIKNEEFNTISIKKINSRYYFYINDYLAGSKKEIKFYGNNFGFSVGLNSQMNVNKFRISYLSPKKNPDSFQLIVQNIFLSDENNNNAIDALEKCSLQFTVKNKGNDSARNVILYPASQKAFQGLQFPEIIELGDIAPMSSKNIVVTIKADKKITDGKAIMYFHFEGINGLAPEDFTKEINVNSLKAPSLKIVDCCFSSKNNRISLGEFIWLNLLVENTGKGNADSVKLYFNYNQINFNINNEAVYIGRLEPGEKKKLQYKFYINEDYSPKTIPITINLSERLGEYGDIKRAVATVDEKLSYCSFGSDIDRNIPKANRKRSNTYALIIGNENYRKYQSGLVQEQNAIYAKNDAQIFAEYVNKTMGVSDKNIRLLTDATAGQMWDHILWLKDLSRSKKGDIEIIFYFAGHGFPDKISKQPYLMPVDVNVKNLCFAIKLDSVVSALSTYSSKRVSIFLDACFSGGGRELSLASTDRGIAIMPKKIEPSGNMFLFSSSSGTETSGSFNNQEHGFFTYYLLKALQEFDGNIRYGEWVEYTKQKVTNKTSALNTGLQNPEERASEQIKKEWRDWHVKP